MQIRNTIRRMAGAALLAAGLAYPACAAVCPKGIGGCTSPGRCFLYVDADSNSLCDYTGRTGSVPSSGSGSSGPGSQAQAAAVPDPAPTQAVSGSAPSAQTSAAAQSTTSSLAQTPGSSLPDTLHVPVLIAGILLFVLFTGVFFHLIRKGFWGIQVRETRPALALSMLLALPLTLMITGILAGGAIPGTVCALVYMAAAPPLLAYLWYTGRLNRRMILAMAGISTLAGFVFVAPIMPLELGGFVGALTGSSAVTLAIVIIGAVVAAALIFGRTFCSCICPVGSIQELAYEVPAGKIRIHRTHLLELVRVIVFAATAAAAAFMIDLLAFSGLYDLFSLTLSAGFGIAIGLVLLSVFLYRPVCRILCPFGVLFSIFAEFSRFRIRRTETCISCRKCERTCPASSAGLCDSKRECYLCGRCTEVCPEGKALRYSGT